MEMIKMLCAECQKGPPYGGMRKTEAVTMMGGDALCSFHARNRKPTPVPTADKTDASEETP